MKWYAILWVTGTYYAPIADIPGYGFHQQVIECNSRIECEAVSARIIEEWFKIDPRPPQYRSVQQMIVSSMERLVP